MATAASAVERGERTREAILDLAVDLASEDGLEGLTIGRLAAELGMSKSGLFGHFGSKEELQLATIEAAGARFLEQVVLPVLKMKPGVRRLRALCDAYVDYLERRVFPGGCFWAAAATEFDGRPGPVRDAVREAVGAWVDGLALEAELAGAPDPRQLAFELHALGQGANTAAQLLDDRQAFKRARVAMHRLLP
jgi:AcrR family transcriptional regulator